MKTAALTLVLLTGCAANQDSSMSEITPAGGQTAVPATSSATPAPTISDSAPGAATPMPPSRVNVVPSVSPDKPLADAIGTSTDAPRTLQAVPATAGDLAEGVVVNDPSGRAVGTIDSTTDDFIVLLVGKQRIQVPRNTIGKNEKGLIIGLTKTEIEAGAKN